MDSNNEQDYLEGAISDQDLSRILDEYDNIPPKLESQTK